MSIVNHLSNILGVAAVITSEEEMRGYLEDERALYHGEAACVVLPRNTQEVADAIKICHNTGYYVVPQGGNTGYCGGASPDGAKQVLLSTSRLKRIRAIDPVGMTVTVEAGVVLAALQEAVAEQGLFFPLSMGSEGSCQVGGILSTNAGGLAVLKYGTAGEQVLGLEVVLPSGEVLDCLSSLRKDNTGYDLKSLFLGAEGSLGVITAAVLKLYPYPTEWQSAWLSAPDLDSVCRLLPLARQHSGDTLTSFEYVSAASMALANQHIEALRLPLESDHPHQVLLEISAPMGTGALREPMEALLQRALEQGLIVDAAMAETGSQRAEFWRIRESIPEAEKIAGRSIKHDVSVPISKIPEYVYQAGETLPGIADHRPSVYGHIGDGNLHYNILAPENADPATFRDQYAAEFSTALHDLAASMQGSFSAEHGIGKLKQADLQRYKSPVALALMEALKSALDPAGTMNPGKVLPRRDDD
jgi:D-lactate dehydrogenase (cytochrome)